MERPQGSQTIDHPACFEMVYDGRLGGCAVNGDGATYYPRMWKYLIDTLSIKSMIDIGCGSGMAADYFKDFDIKVLGVEGCKDAVAKAIIPQELIVLHDYELGPFVPDDEYDLAWSCEFVEHVRHEARMNYFETMKKCKYIAMTFASLGQGGHNHVNENCQWYWIKEITSLGYVFDQDMTSKLRAMATFDFKKYSPYFTSHFITRGLFFRKV